MPKPTNYPYWEATYGIRVVVHDKQVDGIRMTRVGTYPVPQHIIDVAKPFWKAHVEYLNDPRDPQRKAARDDLSLPYKVAVKNSKPPSSGATPVGWLMENPDQSWSWYSDADSNTLHHERTIEKALDMLVASVHETL